MLTSSSSTVRDTPLPPIPHLHGLRQREGRKGTRHTLNYLQPATVRRHTPPTPSPHQAHTANIWHGYTAGGKGSLPDWYWRRKVGTSEEVCLWFWPTASGGDTAHAAGAHVHHSSKRRRECARRRRRREEERRKDEDRCPPPATPTSGVAAMAMAPLASPPTEPPPTEMLPEPNLPDLPSSATSAARAHVFKAQLLALMRVKAALTATRAS